MSEKGKIPVAKIGEIPVGGRKLCEVKGKSIGLFNVNGNHIAVLNICPHEYAPICRGRVSGTTLPSKPGEFAWGRDGEILSCPWYGWEFDLLTGKSLTEKNRRLHTYPVVLENEWVCVQM